MSPPVDLEIVLGHVFEDRRNLERALTHSSLAYERTTGRVDPGSRDEAAPDSDQDNEQLEFLGDAVLGFIVADCLFRSYPELHEGDLTRIRAQLVSRKHLGQVAARLSLGTYLYLGRGEERSGGRHKAVLLANALEAVIAALYLDGGHAAASGFVHRSIVEPYLEDLRAELDAGNAMGDHKSALQEWLQANKSGSPHYTVKAESGPDHCKRFLVEVQVTGADGEQTVAHGAGSTKKKAEQEAARRAFLQLRQPAVPADESDALPVSPDDALTPVRKGTATTVKAIG